ncbi:DNA-3-methyladenine glycosylase [Alkanindiges illinoisensis]|uniref:DNA-3-methyladenine glycosylase n=1 Tax=Alkanindiges illinoisensis TaxID=197183 RepID=UPI000A06870A|nr:DNA-3-methyladenine glycosylase [Alkanindiges illinoisensis]
MQKSPTPSNIAISQPEQVCSNAAQVLAHDWFRRPTAVVAADLIGCYLCRRMDDGQVVRAMITETEAYLGVGDAACHAFEGRHTPRTSVMYKEAGTIYVYLIYGLHYLLNIVTTEIGQPEAVLIRAVHVQGEPIKTGAGPAKLTKRLTIDKRLNNHLLGEQVGLWIENKTEANIPVSVAKRVGIDYAGEAAHWLMRFYWTGHGSVSK